MRHSVRAHLVKFCEVYIFGGYLLLAWLLYSPALGITYFTFDDRLSIVNNPVLRSFPDLIAIFQAFNTRFLLGLSLSCDYAVYGLKAGGYHVTSLFLHVICSYLVYQWLKLLLSISGSFTALARKGSGAVAATGLASAKEILSFYRQREILIAALAALIFLIHPLQSESLNFLTQRAVILMSVFYLATLILYLKGCLTQKAWYFQLAFLTCILAMFCKEAAVTLPIMLCLTERLLLKADKDFRGVRFKRRLPFLLAVLVIPLTLFLTSMKTTPTARIAKIEQAKEGVGASLLAVDITRAGNSEYGRWEYFLTQLKVLGTYGRLLIFPVGQRFLYDDPASQSFWEPAVALSFLAHASLLLLAFFIRKFQPLLSFAIFWFYIALSLESSVIPLGHLVAEYRLYLAGVGFVLGLALLLQALMPVVLGDRGNPLPSSRKGIYGFLLIYVLALGWTTWNRNFIWKDEWRLWEDTVAKSPNSPRALANLAMVYAQQDQPAHVVPLLKEVIRLKPYDATSYLNLGVAYAQLGQESQALAFYKKALHIHARYYEVYWNMALIYAQKQEFEEELACYDKITELKPDFVEAYIRRVVVYHQMADEAGVHNELRRLRVLGKTDLAEQLRQMLADMAPASARHADKPLPNAASF